VHRPHSLLLYNNVRMVPSIPTNDFFLTGEGEEIEGPAEGECFDSCKVEVDPFNRNLSSSPLFRLEFPTVFLVCGGGGIMENEEDPLPDEPISRRRMTASST
jgi:hypothetical protein